METLCVELLEKIFLHVDDEVDKVSLMYVNKRFFSILLNDKNFRNKICFYSAKEGHLDCLKYAYENGYAHENGCPWDEFPRATTCYWD